MLNEINSKFENRMNLGVLLLLNCPKFMEFGIDYSAWTIGEKFMGIKMIPPGPHFIHYSTKEEDYFFKQGFFINISQITKIHIRKWNSEIGEFIHLKDEEEKNFSIGCQNLDFDAFLGDYPHQSFEDWKDLTKFISDKILTKLEPINKKYITSSKEYHDSETENEITNNQPQNVQGTIYYTSIPQKKFFLKMKKEKDGNFKQAEKFQFTPENLTKLNIDKSSILENLITSEYNCDVELLLGEFQYSFITFLLCEVYESFEQWKNILILVLSCCEAIEQKQLFYCDFVEVLYHQFRLFPQDFFYDELSKDNFLSILLSSFMENCKLLPDKSPLNRRIKLFKKFLKEFFGLEIITEEDRIIEKYLRRTQEKDNNLKNKNKNVNYNSIEDDELPVIVDSSEIDRVLCVQNFGNSENMHLEIEYHEKSNNSRTNTNNTSPFYDITMN
jgi:A1 cistron-splicing factor AAR2